MTPVEERARVRSAEYAASCMLVALGAVMLLLVLGYGSALVYDQWREVLNKHNALLFVFSLDGLVLGTVACTCSGLGFAVGLVKGLMRGGKA